MGDKLFWQKIYGEVILNGSANDHMGKDGERVS